MDTEKRFTCKFCGTSTVGAGPVHEYTLAEVHQRWPYIADEIEDLAIGAEHKDSDGDTWERIA